MKSRLGRILLSVGLAVVMWLFVITSVSPGSKQTYYNIPVVLGSESVLAERGLMITNQSASTVTMELSGNRSDLIKVDSSNITLKADLASIYEPGTQIPLNYTVSFPGNVASNAFVVESKNPGRIYITVERRISKSIPVEIRWIGSAPEGFIADRENRVLEYPSVQIVGPQSVTDQIEKAIIEVDLNDQRESISQDYLYTLCNAEGEPVDAELITTNVDQIHVDVRIQRVKDISLTYLLVEGGGASEADVDIALSIDTIRVSGSEAALELMGDQLVIGTINLAEITEDTTKIFAISLEEGISNLTGLSEVTVEIHLKGLAEKEFLLQNIQAVNVPEGLEAELYTKELAVCIRGPEALIDKLQAEDMSVTVDFTGAEIGTSTFRANVTFAAGFEGVGTLRADAVSASVTEKLPEPETQATEEPEN